jgi:hypothetical protein
MANSIGTTKVSPFKIQYQKTSDSIKQSVDIQLVDKDLSPFISIEDLRNESILNQMTNIIATEIDINSLFDEKTSA